MEIKQKRCFHTLMISMWGLEPIEAVARETAEFVNLYSVWRGTNRFIALLKTFDLLRERPEVAAAGVRLPPCEDLRQWVESGAALGNPGLEEAVRATGSVELAGYLKWTKDVNARIARTVKNIPPYPWARESIERISRTSDSMCVSQTPAEALLREWDEHGLIPYLSLIAGQELGSKADHIRLTTQGRYDPSRVLMVGDALGDRDAARANGALFYPIVPSREAESWERFHREAYERFLGGQYAGSYERDRIAEFEARLPDTPPWRR
jgi:phosphoglycolate phosphatase-like HAD superfamily hydrolase